MLEETVLKIVCGSIKWLARALGCASGAVLVLMMLQTSLDVVSNNVFGRPIEGNIEVMTVYYMTAIAFLPLALTEVRSEHIATEFVYRYFPDWLKTTTYLIGSLVSAIFFTVLAYQTFFVALRSTAISEQMMGGVFLPVWPAKWFLPIGFGASALACFVSAVDHVSTTSKKEQHL